VRNGSMRHEPSAPKSGLDIPTNIYDSLPGP